ncbi:DUF6545 domain-containing protein, partial [Streptomyces sp. NPDC004288]
MHDGLVYYLTALVLGGAFLAKLPALRRGWRLPTVRAVHVLLFLPCTALLLSAPPTIRFVNRQSGICNLSALLVHCCISGFACACLVLMEYWRGDPLGWERTQRRAQGWIFVYGAVIVSLVVFFVLGEAPVERPVDFDVYYADAPFIREMLVLYLLAFVVAGFITMRACWRWTVEIGDLARCPDGAPEGSRSLRAGLLGIVVVSLGAVLFGVSKLAAIAARWSGHDWHRLNENVALLMSLFSLVIGLGLLVAAFGPRLADHVWHPLVSLADLRPLWRVVRLSETGARSGPLPATPWWAGPEHRLMARITAIHDWMLRLRAYCEDDVREDAYRRALAEGMAECAAVATGLTAMLRAAAAARAAGT